MDSTLYSTKRSSGSVVWSSNAIYGWPSPRLHDFQELFSFNSSNSIPVLDLPSSARHDLDTRAPSTAFEYDDVFASSSNEDSALSFDDLLEKDKPPAWADLASSQSDASKEDLNKLCKPMLCTMISDDSQVETDIVFEVTDTVSLSDESLRKSSVSKGTGDKTAGEEGEREQQEKKHDKISHGESVKARIAAFERRFKEMESFQGNEENDKMEPFKTIPEGKEKLKQKTLVEDDIILELVGNEVELDEEQEKEKTSAKEDEPPTRTQARLRRHKRVSENAARALAEKTKRDDMEEGEAIERERVAEALDSEVNRWSSGKEGNLRALLSTLQYILGAGSGWQAVSLTDIVATAAVKKAYKKATLCLHPDKLQQRGASIHQKYISEKVFDLLKNAWTIFNAEEW